jgi:DNA-binding NarL/FixJ family response regulator
MSTARATAERIDVVVVDDNAEFRAVAREVIEHTDGFEAVAVLSDAVGLAGRLDQRPADVVLLDVRMPGIGGVAAARTLAPPPAGPMVVLLSADDCPDIAADPPAHGASAFFPKQAFGPAMLRRLRDTARRRAR